MYVCDICNICMYVTWQGPEPGAEMVMKYMYIGSQVSI